MRFFWKALLIGLGSYWLYKKSNSRSSGDTETHPEQAEATTSQFTPPENAFRKQKETNAETEIPTAQIIERLTEIEGVTNRVAENLVEKGIYSRKALTALSRNKLMEIKGVGPKRAEKILGR